MMGACFASVHRAWEEESRMLCGFPRSDERAAVPPGLRLSGCTGHGRAWQAARARPSAPGFRACGARAGQTRECSAPEELARGISTRNHREKTNFSCRDSPREVSHSV